MKRGLLALLLPAAHVCLEHMNSIPGGYKVSNALPGFEDKSWSFRGDFFEVRTGVMGTRYSEVYWLTLPPVALPPQVVKEFKNKYIAITGFEVDVKRINNRTGAEESVPVYHSYNHHYGPALRSSYAEEIVDKAGQPMGPDHGHGPTLTFRVKEGARPPADAKLVENFVHGNGNEHRQVYHGAPRGFGQLIYSPGHFTITAMQINTNFNGSDYRGGPMPAFSRAHAPPEAPYNPLFECPCTSRIVKELDSVIAQLAGTCEQLPISAADCFAGAAKAFGVATVVANASTSSKELPPGCTVSRHAAGLDALVATWNDDRGSSVACDGGKGDASRAMGHTVDLVDVRVDVDAQADVVTLTLSGPSAVWFGVGFNATAMQDEPYAVIAEGDGTISERKLANHAPGQPLQASLQVVSNDVVDGVRTVTLTRPLHGLSRDHYTFSLATPTIHFINAVGNTPAFAQHVERHAATLWLVRVDAAAPTCLCASAEGLIDGYPLKAGCKPEPTSDLLATNNPTCQVSTYVGGLACCRHGTFLLDADQAVPPYVDRTFFRFRFYYEPYEPAALTPIYHVEWSSNGCDSGISQPTQYSCSHIEFDVPASPNATTRTFQSTFKAGHMLADSCAMTSAQCMDRAKAGPGGIMLVMAAAHCHAPNCLRQELWNLDAHELLCAVEPVHGASERLFDEAGYLFTPPCLWGSKEEGLQAPPKLLLNTTMQMLTVFDSRWYHPGQMGIWQMKAAFVA